MVLELNIQLRKLLRRVVKRDIRPWAAQRESERPQSIPSLSAVTDGCSHLEQNRAKSVKPHCRRRRETSVVLTGNQRRVTVYRWLDALQRWWIWARPWSDPANMMEEWTQIRKKSRKTGQPWRVLFVWHAWSHILSILPIFIFHPGRILAPTFWKVAKYWHWLLLENTAKVNLVQCVAIKNNEHLFEDW